MPRKKKRFWDLGLNPKSTRSLTALILILFALLSLLSLIGHLLELDNSLYTQLQRLFGTGAILVPFVSLSAGLSLTNIRWEIAQPRIFWGLLIALIGMVTLFHVLFNSENSYAVVRIGGAGGILGFYIGRLLINIFSVFGAFLLAIGLIIIGLLIIFNTTMEELGVFIGKVTVPVVAGFQRYLIAPVRLGLLRVRSNEEQDEVPTEQTATSGIKINRPPDKKPQIEIVDEPASGTTPVTTSEDTSMAATTIPYEPPAISLLSDIGEVAADRGDVEKNAAIIEKTLDSFGVQARVAEINFGPAVTQYALNLAEGTKINKITSLQNDLALALAAPTGAVRVEAPIPGKKFVGIEVPNYTPTLVTMRDALLSENAQTSKAKLMVTLGQDVSGETEVADLTKWPHVLVAGATGAGKSVLLHSLIISLLYRMRPDEVQFMFIDPKRVELTQYNGIPHLLRSVIVDPEKAVNAFKWAVHEMEHRYKLFQQIQGARDLASFNSLTDTPPLPYIVIIVDEMADLMSYAKNEAEGLITRLAQMSRATGIHLVLATQRPSVDVITGLIKANIPTRIALNVTSITDSRVILDSGGAEKLIGKGDMLYLPPDAAKPRRVQGVYVSDDELARVINHLKQFGGPQPSVREAEEGPAPVTPVEPVEQDWQGVSASGRAPDFEEPEDNKFDEAVGEILNHDRASASLLQRRLKIGYARAARLLDELEERGMVSPKDGSNPREVYTSKVQEYLTQSGQAPEPYLRE